MAMLNDEQLNEMNHILGAFNLSRKMRKMFYNLQTTLFQNNKSWLDFLEYITTINTIEEEIYKRDLKRSKYCPECNGIMGLLPVNTEPGNQTGDPDDKSVWLCSNQKCQETIFNKETVTEIQTTENY